MKKVKLGEVLKIQRGASPRPIHQYITEGEGIPWIKIGDTSENSKYITKTSQKLTIEGAKKSRILKKGDFILSNSMSYGRPYIINMEKGAIHDGWASLSEFEEYLNSEYLFYFLSSSLVQEYWRQQINNGTVSNLNSEIIAKLEISIPPLSIQKEIVRILDKFDTLVNDIKEGLPAEIEMRQKQYEYYRDKLLDFKKLNVEG